MTVTELRQAIATYEKDLKDDKSGSVVVFSENGPANMGLIRSISEVLAKLESRIAQLERR